MHQDRADKERQEKTIEGCSNFAASVAAVIIFALMWGFLSEFIRLVYLYYGGQDSTMSNISITVTSFMMMARYFNFSYRATKIYRRNKGNITDASHKKEL